MKVWIVMHDQVDTDIGTNSSYIRGVFDSEEKAFSHITTHIGYDKLKLKRYENINLWYAQNPEYDSEALSIDEYEVQ